MRELERFVAQNGKAILALFLAASLILFLSGCAGAVPGNPQGYAGINMGEFTYNAKTGDVTGKVIGGKESDRVALKVETPGGLHVEYSARGNKAVNGQAIRAAVEQAVSADVRKVAPGIVGRIVAAVLGVLP